jgi:decaprenyl-phosphate phosphoribosyltransferase
VSAVETPAADPHAQPGGAPPRGSLVRGLIRTARPKQYVKNVLVFAAPVAGGVLTDPGVPVKELLTFIAFCLVSSATYFLNDIIDVERDRRHPTKRNRPIAAGVVPVNAAWAAGAACMVAGLGLAFAVNWKLGLLLTAYKALMIAYTFKLKHIAVVDIAVVATGFIVRAVAGGLAVDITLSRWFLIVTCFGSLFMVAGKRHGEFMHIGDASTRPALAGYTLEYLRFVWTMSATIAIAAYCLWAFEHPTPSSGISWWGLSIVPFVLAIMRYALIVERGEGSAPEEVVLSDRTLQVFGLIWLALFACSVYVT